MFRRFLIIVVVAFLVVGRGLVGGESVGVMRLLEEVEVIVVDSGGSVSCRESMGEVHRRRILFRFLVGSCRKSIWENVWLLFEGSGIVFDVFERNLLKPSTTVKLRC